MCLYTSIKYFPLVITSLVQNTTPILVALLQWKLHKVHLSTIDKATLAFSFLGIIVLITGTMSKDSASSHEFTFLQLIFPCICLILMPFNGAIMNVLLREMRDMAEFTLGTYIVLTMLIVYLPIFMFCETTDVYYKFTLNDWLVAVLLGFTSSSMPLARTKAMKYEEPARLNILNYF